MARGNPRGILKRSGEIAIGQIRDRVSWENIAVAFFLRLAWNRALYALRYRRYGRAKSNMHSECDTRVREPLTRCRDNEHPVIRHEPVKPVTFRGWEPENSDFSRGLSAPTRKTVTLGEDDPLPSLILFFFFLFTWSDFFAFRLSMARISKSKDLAIKRDIVSWKEHFYELHFRGFLFAWNELVKMFWIE